MSTIASLRAAMTDELNAQAAVHGENTELSSIGKNDVSYGVDNINETWNDTLPPRPKS